MSRSQNVFTFPAGLPGLPRELTRFELTALAKDSPFFFLQSLQEDGIGFILANPFALFPDYEFELPEEDAAVLGVKKPQDAVVFCIVNAAQGFENATVNLLAPLALNTAAGAGRQVVLNDRRYSVRHPLPRPRSNSGGHSPDTDDAGPKTASITVSDKVSLPAAPAGIRTQTASPATVGAGKKSPAGEGE